LLKPNRKIMQFIDLAFQQTLIKTEIDAAIQTVLSHGKYIMGPEVLELERCLSEYIGVQHGISCASGTDALLMALLALDVKPNDAIFTSPFTFIATAEVISLIGATPVFVDIDPKTFNIDPEKLALAIEETATSPLNPKGIIPVDIFGLPADYDGIKQVAGQKNLFVLEDAAQSLGAEYKNRKACSVAEVACTSFFPAKPLGCYGDGGMIFTDDDEIANSLRSIRVHGKGTHKYDNMRIGINGRLDTLQAAILNTKFKLFPKEVELRQQVAQRYSDLLSKSGNCVITPHVPEGFKSAWAQYSVLAKDQNHRLKIQEKLKAENIPTAIYYPKPLHLQTAFSNLGYTEGCFPVSEDCSNRIFSLPMHPYLKAEDQEKIATVINKA
jgi:UDP-2-acetamido-2-deoxy-ribo-hexuluronate aminotransferase